MADARLEIILSAKDQTTAAFSSAAKGLSNLSTNGNSASKALGTLAGDAIKLASVAGGALAVALGSVVKVAANFETAMSGVQAVTAATPEEMATLGRAALALGKDTELAGISATDAAKAMEELGKGGVTVEQQLGGATRGALLLASAGELEVGEAAEIATKAMNVFGLSGADVAHVADLLSAGANTSATSVHELGAAFNQSASVARGAGFSIEDLTGTLAFFAQRGLEGSDAGTSLKTAILRLQSPTAEVAKLMDDLGLKTRDAGGNMLPMPQLADNIRNALKDLTPAQRDAALATIFGNDAIRIGLGLYEGGGDAIRTWTKNVDDAGSAAKTGATRNDNLLGSLSQLQSTLETGAVAIGTKFLPMLHTATDETTKLIDKILDSPEAQRAIENLANKGSDALKNFFRTVQDPVFQDKAKEWLNAAVETGKAIISFAGTIKDVLGPPMQAAAGWFNDLDEGGKKNVLSFGLAALAAGKYHSELSTLLSIIPAVIKAFGEKEAAKKTLTKANENLAGSAGQTAKAMGGTTTAASAAALAIADVAAVSLVSVGMAAGVATGFGALATAMDTNNQRARDFVIAQEAANLALMNGATPQNGAIDGYLRLVLALGPAVTGQGDLVRLWNQYVESLPPGTAAVDGVRLAFAGTVQPTQDAAMGLRGVTDGLGNITSAAGPLTTKLGAAVKALSDTMTTAVTLTDPGLRGVTDGLGNVASAAGATATTLNTQLTPAIAGSGLAAGAFTSAVAGAQGAVDNYDKALQGLSSDRGHLQSYLATLQKEWDDLNVATNNGVNVTEEQRKRYELLAPAINYLNSKIGENKSATVDATLAAIDQQQAVDNATKAAALATLAQGGYRIGLDLATLAAQGNRESTDDLALALHVAQQRTDDLIGAFRRVPHDVSTQVETPGLSDADQGVRNYLGALNSIPSNVSTTITTHYNTVGSPAQASLSGFRANGGPVQPRRAYVVGERGPELFVPSSGGIISPNTGRFGQNGSGGGSGGTVNNITVTGNTLLQDSPVVAQSLADILAPALAQQVSYSY